MIRNVKGVLFADYVRMIRHSKQRDWTGDLAPEDLRYLTERIVPEAWYPMASFERLGNAILREVADGDLEAVRFWGHESVDLLRVSFPTLIADGDPVETLRRFRVLRSSFFDFTSIEILLLVENSAQILIHYHMGAVAEEAACYQTMGFFERLVELGGASEVDARFVERSWANDPRTLLELQWRAPR